MSTAVVLVVELRREWDEFQMIQKTCQSCKQLYLSDSKFRLTRGIMPGFVTQTCLRRYTLKGGVVSGLDNVEYYNLCDYCLWALGFENNFTDEHLYGMFVDQHLLDDRVFTQTIAL